MIETHVEKKVLKETFADEEAGKLEVGTNNDDVIEINGILKIGKNKTRFVIIITNQESQPSTDFSMKPDILKLQGLFGNANFEGRKVMLPYSVGNNNELIYMNAEVSNYKV